MELFVAFGTDDGKNLKSDDHVGMSRYFYVYRCSKGKEEFIEKRENVKFEGNESMRHGDSGKAKATISVLKNVDVLVGRRFGPNLPKLLKKFVCVISRAYTIDDTIEFLYINMDKILKEKKQKENRKHIVLRLS
jgi:predicted Fe-Mo cluster-binding NifX family protein